VPGNLNCPTVINLWLAANVQIKCMWQTIVSAFWALRWVAPTLDPQPSTLECVLPQVFKIVLVSAGLHPVTQPTFGCQRLAAGDKSSKSCKPRGRMVGVGVVGPLFSGGLNLLYIWIFPSLARNSSVRTTKWISSCRLASFFNSFNLAACEVETFQDKSKQTALFWTRLPLPCRRIKSIVGIRVFVLHIERK